MHPTSVVVLHRAPLPERPLAPARVPPMCAGTTLPHGKQHTARVDGGWGRRPLVIGVGQGGREGQRTPWGSAQGPGRPGAQRPGWSGAQGPSCCRPFVLQADDGPSLVRMGPA